MGKCDSNKKNRDIIQYIEIATRHMGEEGEREREDKIPSGNIKELIYERE